MIQMQQTAFRRKNAGKTKHQPQPAIWRLGLGTNLSLKFQGLRAQICAEFEN
jgi:hypothetical protein